MSEISLRTVGLGKMYRIGGERESYRTLRDTLVHAARRPLERIRHPGAATHVSEDLWALKDVDLEVARGEVLGVIGRNGSGKSTLLKVLSRITEPTEGKVQIKGRVASLLEVGTGFHGELTGRENIQLNGAILGMTRAEIKSKFDEIVEFSEIGRFLDTPVKRYSSGMYMRLAFAVAAHLESEILAVDEVLAVGDAGFQAKCLGKMKSVSRNEGRTIVFVTHQMAAVSALCSRGIVLDEGRVAYAGSIGSAIERYLHKAVSSERRKAIPSTSARRGNGEARIEAFWLEDDRGAEVATVANGHPCRFVARVRCAANEGSPINGVAVTFSVRSFFGATVFYHHHLLTGRPYDGLHGVVDFRLHVDRLPLPAGRYALDAGLSRDSGRTEIDVVDGLLGFEVFDGDFFGTGASYTGGPNPAVMVDGRWTAEEVPDEPASRPKA